MNHHPTPALTASGCIGAVLLAALLLTTWHLAEDDASTAAHVASLARQQAQLEARQLIGATHLCQAELGPGARPGFTASGDLVCQPADQPAH